MLAGAPVRAPWPLVECCACAHCMTMQCACARSADAQAMPRLAQWHTCPEEALLCVFPREMSFPRGFSKESSANLRASSLHDAQAHVACPEVGLRVWAECAASREAPGVGLPAGLGPAAPPAALAAKPRSVDRAGGRGRSGGLPGVRQPRGSESAGPARSLGSLTPDATRLGAPPSESPVPPWVSARPGLQG